MARLTIPDEQTYAEFTVTSSTTAFPISFAVFAKADLTVLVDGEALNQSDFTFTGTLLEGGGYQGGTITLNDAVDDVTVRIERNIAAARADNFAPAASAPVRAVDMALNRQMAVSQDIVRRVASIEGVALDEAAIDALVAAAAQEAAAAENARAAAALILAQVVDAIGDPLIDFGSWSADGGLIDFGAFAG